MRRGTDLRYLLLMPSFYGAVTWLPWLVLYWMRLLPWNETSALAMTLYAGMALAFLASIVVFSSRYRVLARAGSETRHVSTAKRMLLLAAHALGFIGIVKYVSDFGRAFGGVQGFALLLQNSPHLIRLEQMEQSSAGTQLAYFGWIAVNVTALWVHENRLSRWWLLPSILQFIGNLLFINRMRPIWMLFVTACTLIPATRKVTIGRLTKTLGLAAACAGALFVALGVWIGKISTERKLEEASALPVSMQSLYYYGTSGFAYFDDILRRDPTPAVELVPKRLAYPLIKALNALELADEPPAQILEFRDLPYSTNVGTVLEPFYRDGGLVYTLLGICFASFVMDFLALILWRTKGVLANVAAANLCFASLLAFFAAKITTFPLWFACGLGLSAIAGEVLRRPRIPGRLATDAQDIGSGVKTST